MTHHPAVPPDNDTPGLDVEVLRCGQITLLGQVAKSSNETFLVEVTLGDQARWGIYKPELGERPLMDFPPGLHRREVAAYLLSEALGWHLVPATVLRHDGPLGIGSVQLFIDHDPADQYFTLLEHKPDTYDQLRRLAVFDLIANNADRKAGHVLYGNEGKIWGIDHGLCFATSMKLRTVIWDFAREAIPTNLLDDMCSLAEQLPEFLAEQLTSLEVVTLKDRIRQLLEDPHFPHDPTGRRFPWPLV